MAYDQGITQRRLEELKGAFEIDNAGGIVEPSVEGLRRNAASLLSVILGLRDLSDDLSEHAGALGVGPNADPKVVAALPHYEELSTSLAAAWRSVFNIHEALQVLDPDRGLIDPSDIEDDGGEWVKAD